MALYVDAFPGLTPDAYWALDLNEVAALGRRLSRRR